MAPKGGEGQTIIVKKIKKGGHGHHGGAWKVAYADFVTAMMAFFLLLWLLNATTAEQKQAIAFYFDPFSVSKSTSGSGGVMGGTSMISPGAAVSDATAPGQTTAMPMPESNGENQGNDSSTSRDVTQNGDFSDLDGGEPLSQEEKKAFDNVEKQIMTALQSKAELAGLKDNVKFEKTEDGLIIQLIDSEGRPMFAPGKIEPLPHAQALLATVAESVARLSNKIDITGHTDASTLRGPGGQNYDNWDLSADRANASRKVMVQSGMAPNRLARVSGRAASDLLIPDRPLDPGNRRISITLQRENSKKTQNRSTERSGGPGGPSRPTARERVVPVPSAPAPLPDFQNNNGSLEQKSP